MLKPTEILALSKVVTDSQAKEARASLSHGILDVDFSVRVWGGLSIAPDTDAKPTASLPVKEVLALFFHRCGMQRERALELLRSCMVEALQASSSGSGALTHLQEVREAMYWLETDLLDKLPRVPRKGVVKAVLQLKDLNAANTAV